jgi:hypothetical protein
MELQAYLQVSALTKTLATVAVISGKHKLYSLGSIFLMEFGIATKDIFVSRDFTWIAVYWMKI